jgi:hypothetical protein
VPHQVAAALDRDQRAVGAASPFSVLRTGSELLGSGKEAVVGIAKAYEDHREDAVITRRRRSAHRPNPDGVVRIPMRSLAWTVSTIFHQLMADGHGWLAQLVVDEWKTDRVRMLSELRVVLIEQGYTDMFDR